MSARPASSPAAFSLTMAAQRRMVAGWAVGKVMAVALLASCSIAVGLKSTSVMAAEAARTATSEGAWLPSAAVVRRAVEAAV